MEHALDQFELSLNSLPVPTPEAYLLINDFSSELLAGSLPHEEYRSVLERMYADLSTLDMNMVSFVASFEEGGRLSRDEILVLTCYFLMQARANPEQVELRNILYTGRADVEEFAQKVAEHGIPTPLAVLLNNAYQKIYTPNNLS